MKKSIFLSVLFAVLFAFSMTASASEPIGEITISDDDSPVIVTVWYYVSGNPSPNSLVQLTQGGQVIHQSTTGPQGKALIFGVNPGTYNIGCDNLVGAAGSQINAVVTSKSAEFHIHADIFY